MILKLEIGPDNPTLRAVAAPVTKFDKKLKKLIADLKDTMADPAAPGVGIAAPQVGVLSRVAIIDLGEEHGEVWISRPVALVNPEIIAASQEMLESDEGCLSLPSWFGVVPRHRAVTVRFQDEAGREKTLSLEGFPAFIVQHELDHLNGVLFIDHLPAKERDKLLAKGCPPKQKN